MCRESNRANLANVWLNTVVDPHMNFEVAPLCKPFLANFALERLNALVGPDVDLQAASPRVGLITVGTFIRLFARMNQFMGLKVTSGYEFFITITALKRSFTGLKN